MIQGWDDLGLHHPTDRPNYVHTPNMDRFVENGLQFTSFYTAPMCSQSRSELLTGRSYPKTGTLLVNGEPLTDTAEQACGSVVQRQLDGPLKNRVRGSALLVGCTRNTRFARDSPPIPCC